MRYLGSLWERCNNGDVPRGEWDYQRRLTIDGVVYNDENIISVTHDKGLIANSFSIGNTISGSIKATVIPHTDHTVRKNGKILLELRIATINDGDTEWFEFGHYYVNSAMREKDKWTVNGYDAINQLETPFVTNITDWPQTCSIAINQILSFLNIELDSRTYINSSLDIQDPTEFTMREVLGYIGGLHGGNWYITETNKLRLIIPSLDTKVATVSPGNTKKLVDGGVMNFDKVILKFSSSVKDKYTSGSGKNELDVYNPWGTQSTADNIRSILSNYDYYPGEYKSTEINPAVELGDTIEIDGKLVNLWQVNYSTRIYADIYMPDQTDKYRDTYNFAVDVNAFDWDYDGGGGDVGENYEDRISLLEDMLGIKECVILSTKDIDEDAYKYESNAFKELSIGQYIGESTSCIILPRILNGSVIKGVNGLFEGVGGRWRPLNKVINNNDNLTSIERLFRGFYVPSLDLSRFNTVNVTNMKRAFASSDVEELNLSNFNTSSAVDMDSMFSRSKATTLDLSSFNTSNVTNMSSMFSGSEATTLNLGNFNTSKVTNMSNMFSGSEATTINVSSFDTSSVTRMDGMFHSSPASTLSLSNFDTSRVSLMSSMFENSKASVIDVSSFRTYSATDMRWMFHGAHNVEELDLSGFNLERFADDNRSRWQSPWDVEPFHALPDFLPGRFIGGDELPRISSRPLTVYFRNLKDLEIARHSYFIDYRGQNESDNLVTFTTK